ncbi:SAG family member [Eimeria praecox]|uniref:SAG family member n=1 Tax=Eimeria praecox TaxID=51316 RepID=U6H164_9EIME|nr:SAG family member [Eimeria praecox]
MDDPGTPPPAVTTPKTQYVATLGSEAECLSDINAARVKAGLNEFVQAPNNDSSKRLPVESTVDSENYGTWTWKPVCDVFFPEEAEQKVTGGSAGSQFVGGTYAYHVVDTAPANCTAAVDTWNAAYKNFNGLPPTYTAGNELYKDQNNVSFVAIYNPSDGATADCRVVTCKKTVTTTTKNTQGGEGGDTKTEEKEGSALICLTTPDVLSKSIDTPPFTDEHWGEIATALKGSASAVLPSLLGLAAAALCAVGAMRGLETSVESILVSHLIRMRVPSKPREPLLKHRSALEQLHQLESIGYTLVCITAPDELKASGTAPFTLLTLVGALLAFVGGSSGAETTYTYSVKLGDEGACLTKINSAREAAGFSNFVQANADATGKRLPAGFESDDGTEYNSSAWKSVCDVLLPKTSDTNPAIAATLTKFDSGTYAFKALKSDVPDCSAVVDEWKGAYKNFDGPPPPNSKDQQLYSNPTNVSLVAIYNPSSGATADCRVVTCSRTTQTTEPQATESASGFALICMTTPDVLPEDNSTVPFTDEQWKRIVKAIKGSAVTAVPSLLGLAATALSVALLVL